MKLTKSQQLKAARIIGTASIITTVVTVGLVYTREYRMAQKRLSRQRAQYR